MPAFNRVDIDQDVHRVVASRHPTIGVFDELVDDDDEIRQLFELEMMTNPRLNTASKRLTRIPKGEIVTGDSAHQVMAAFVHCHDDGGRFNDGGLGAWYASFEVETALAEAEHHLNSRLGMSEGGFPQRVELRQLITTVKEPLLDLRGAQTTNPELYDAEDYSASQNFANSIRWPFVKHGEAGLCFDSVRAPGGVNVCVFKPSAIGRPVVQGNHYAYEWDLKGQITLSLLTKIKG